MSHDTAVVNVLPIKKVPHLTNRTFCFALSGYHERQKFIGDRMRADVVNTDFSKAVGKVDDPIVFHKKSKARLYMTIEHFLPFFFLSNLKGSTTVTLWTVSSSLNTIPP